MFAAAAGAITLAVGTALGCGTPPQVFGFRATPASSLVFMVEAGVPPYNGNMTILDVIATSHGTDSAAGREGYY